MLAMKRLPCLRAASIRLTWPACRLPMVGTNTTRSCASCQRDTCSRTAAMVVAVSMGSGCASGVELVLGGRITLLLDRLHVLLDGIEIGTGAFHEILHETRLATRGDVEHVVQHQDLSVG